MGRSLALLICLSTLAGLACASPRTYRRTLLVDQLPPYAARAQVFKTLHDGRWCVSRGIPGVEMWKKCDPEDREYGQRLALRFYEGKLVHAAFMTPFVPVPRRRPRPSSVDGFSRLNDTTRDNTALEGKRAHIHEPITQPASAEEAGAPVQGEALEKRMFAALAAELIRRYGNPENGIVTRRLRWARTVSGTWRVSPVAEVRLVVTLWMVVETWAFAPWEIDRIPTPRELKGAKARQQGPSMTAKPTAGEEFNGYVADPVDKPPPLEEPPARVAEPVRPCRRTARSGFWRCPTDFYCVLDEGKEICRPLAAPVRRRKWPKVREPEAPEVKEPPALPPTKQPPAPPAP